MIPYSEKQKSPSFRIGRNITGCPPIPDAKPQPALASAAPSSRSQQTRLPTQALAQGLPLRTPWWPGSPQHPGALWGQWKEREDGSRNLSPKASHSHASQILSG